MRIKKINKKNSTLIRVLLVLLTAMVFVPLALPLSTPIVFAESIYDEKKEPLSASHACDEVLKASKEPGANLMSVLDQTLTRVETSKDALKVIECVSPSMFKVTSDFFEAQMCGRFEIEDVSVDAVRLFLKRNPAYPILTALKGYGEDGAAAYRSTLEYYRIKCRHPDIYTRLTAFEIAVGQGTISIDEEP